MIAIALSWPDVAALALVFAFLAFVIWLWER